MNTVVSKRIKRPWFIYRDTNPFNWMPPIPLPVRSRFVSREMTTRTSAGLKCYRNRLSIQRQPATIVLYRPRSFLLVIKQRDAQSFQAYHERSIHCSSKPVAKSVQKERASVSKTKHQLWRSTTHGTKYHITSHHSHAGPILGRTSTQTGGSGGFGGIWREGIVVVMSSSSMALLSSSSSLFLHHHHHRRHYSLELKGTCLATASYKADQLNVNNNKINRRGLRRLSLPPSFGGSSCNNDNGSNFGSNNSFGNSFGGY